MSILQILRRAKFELRRAADACVVFNYECKGDGTMRALIFEFRNTAAVWMFALFPLNNTVYQTIKDN